MAPDLNKWSREKRNLYLKAIGPPPFVRQDRGITFYEGLKMFIMTPVALVRFILCVLMLILLMVIIKIATLGMGKTLGKVPLSGFRRTMTLFIVPFCRIILFISGFYWIPVYGKKNLDRRPGHAAPLLIANHRSYLDPALLHKLGSGSFVAKADVADIPGVGTVATALGTLFVSRGKDRRATNQKVVEAIEDRCANFDIRSTGPLYLFPEGTTHNGRFVLQFKRGAFTGGFPVQPVIVRYPFWNFDLSWDVYKGMRHVWRMLCQFINFASIEVLPVYYPSEAEKADWKLYSENVRQLYAEHLQLPTTNMDLRVQMPYSDYIVHNRITLQEYLDWQDDIVENPLSPRSEPPATAIPTEVERERRSSLVEGTTPPEGIEYANTAQKV